MPRPAPDDPSPARRGSGAAGHDDGRRLAAAWIVYRYPGLRAPRSAWRDADRAWALGPIASGGAALTMA